jgi:hypothetical protein
MARPALDRCHDAFARLFPGKHADFLLGDLAEEYRLRNRQSRLGSLVWYGSQLIRSLIILFLTAVRHSEWRVLVGAALIYVAAQVIEAGATAALTLLTESVGPVSGAGVAVGLMTAAAAGYVGAWYRPEAPTVLAAMSAITVIALMLLAPHSAPVWYQLVFLVAGPLAVLTGGACVSRRI